MVFSLGLDIGIASCGWGIIDENYKIIDSGVRLFPEAKSDNTISRRTKRGGRRLLRRRQHRLERVKNLLFDKKIISDRNFNFYINEPNPYFLRKKGLYEKLTEQELSIALYHLAKRRGLHEFTIDSNSKDEEGISTKAILKENDEFLKDKYVCELQIERFINKNIDENNRSIRGVKNKFKTTDYVKEANKILETQKSFNSKIDDDFITRYIKILSHRREYYDGPSSPSQYGWKNQEEWMDKLVGRCTYFPEENRIVKNSYTAELFNLLNDLNNLTLKRELDKKLTKEEKEKIIEIFKTTKTVTLKRIAKELNINELDIIGYRIDKNEKPIFTELKSYIEINKIFTCEDRDTLDDISKICTYFQSFTERKKSLKEILTKVDDEILDSLSEIKFTGTHSLSKKAINLILDDLLETNKNQMELFTELSLNPYKMDFKGKKRIPYHYLDEWILSPVVKRSIKQSLKVINEIIKKYGQPKEIVIELAREKNSDDKRKFIKDIQKKNEKSNKEIKELLEGRKLEGRYFDFLKNWKAQDGICFYSGEKIKIEHLIAYPESYEIDHIIPRSISFDDSQDNKVLVKSIENQNKGQMSPYEYFSSGKASMSYDTFKKNVLDLRKKGMISKRKMENLLLEEDITKYTKNFIARNLVDTRYATRELSNMLKKFFKDNEKDVKIKAIKGSFTSQIRKQWKLNKMRDVSHVHHAQDALIILMAEKILNKLRWVKSYEQGDETLVANMKTGEIIDDKEFKEMFEFKYGESIKNYPNYKFSHFVDKKPNRQISNDTIYSTRTVKEEEGSGKKKTIVENEYVIGKISNIYSKDNVTLAEYFSGKKDFKKLLMYHHDKQTFDKFMQVYKEYEDDYKKSKLKVNPFYLFFEEHKEYITKYAKKNNGPIVKEIKYYQNKLGNHIDISHKYKSKNKKVILDTINTFRTDIYYDGKRYIPVGIRYFMLEDRGDYYELNSDKHNSHLLKRGINSSFKFMFSLFTGDIIEYTKQNNKTGEKTVEKLKFKGLNDEKSNKIEVDLINKDHGSYINNIKLLKKNIEDNNNFNPTEKFFDITGEYLSRKDIEEKINLIPISSNQKFFTLSKDLNNFKKIYVNVLGQEFTSEEKFISKIKK